MSTHIERDCLDPIALSGAIESPARQIYSLLLKFVTSDSQQRMQAIEQQMKSRQTELDTALTKYQASVNSEKGKELFARMSDTFKQWEAVKEKTMGLVRQYNTAEAAEEMEKRATPCFDLFIQTALDLRQYDTTHGKDFVSAINGTVVAAQRTINIGLLVCVLVASGIGYILTRSTTRRLTVMISGLSNTAQRTSDASAHVSAASSSLAHGAAEQAAALEQSTASGVGVPVGIKRIINSLDFRRNQDSVFPSAIIFGNQLQDRFKAAVAS